MSSLPRNEEQVQESTPRQETISVISTWSNLSRFQAVSEFEMDVLC